MKAMNKKELKEHEARERKLVDELDAKIGGVVPSLGVVDSNGKLRETKKSSKK